MGNGDQASDLGTFGVPSGLDCHGLEATVAASSGMLPAIANAVASRRSTCSSSESATGCGPSHTHKLEAPAPATPILMQQRIIGFDVVLSCAVLL